MNKDKPVSLRLSGRILFEEDITLAQAAWIIAFLDQPQKENGSLFYESNISEIGKTEPSIPSPQDALEISGAKINSEKIVVFGIYALQEQNKTTFTLEDVKSLFQRAREPIPKNITRDLDTAVKTGWIAKSESSGEFYVTNKAANVLEVGFETIRTQKTYVQKPRLSKAKRQTKTTKEDTPESFRSMDHISPTIEGLIDYHKLNTRTDKFLWAIYKAKNLGVGEVSNQDIIWLTDQLGEAIKSKDISNNFNLNQRAGYVNRSIQSNKIRITPKGEEYLMAKSI